MAPQKNRYIQIIEAIFLKYYREGLTAFSFDREEIADTATALGIKPPKNLGDVIYSFRYRVDLPAAIAKTTPAGLEWFIRSSGRARYTFVLSSQKVITPSPILAETKILDATPEVINRYALSDEQALLAKLRYNRLIDIFTGLTCYSLQNHLRTTVAGIGQVETDEVYIAVDKRGVHYVLPVQAKGGRDRIGFVQIEQDFALCAAKFPQLISIPIAAQFITHEVIALFAFEESDNGLVLAGERHYRLVGSSELAADELASYRKRPL